MKKYIKKNLISFVIGLILFGSLGVYAIVTFNSKDVTYNNKTSGLSSNNVQGAIDELYKECTKVPTSGGTILDNEEIVSSEDGLYQDEYEQGRYIYKGKNVNNYITFNNETWRIVSVEADKTIKIIRDTGIGNMVWDSTNSSNWIKPAELNTYLNGTYLTGTLNQTAQNQIVAKEFNVGSIDYENDDLTVQVNNEKNKKWKGKVALITASEYLRSNSDISNCSTYNTNNNNYNNCKNTTWMYINDIWWTLSAHNQFDGNVANIRSDGSIGDHYVHFGSAVRPSVYLSSEVQITGGDGSQNNPYTLG